MYKLQTQSQSMKFEAREAKDQERRRFGSDEIYKHIVNSLHYGHQNAVHPLLK